MKFTIPHLGLVLALTPKLVASKTCPPDPAVFLTKDADISGYQAALDACYVVLIPDVEAIVDEAVDAALSTVDCNNYTPEIRDLLNCEPGTGFAGLLDSNAESDCPPDAMQYFNNNVFDNIAYNDAVSKCWGYDPIADPYGAEVDCTWIPKEAQVWVNCAPTGDQDCSTSNDCPRDMYCASSSGRCLPMGECDEPVDCKSPDNSIMLATCVGTTTCDGGMCGIDCAEGEDFCSSSDDCPEDMFCSANPDFPRFCLFMGECHDAMDCDDPDNEFAMALCIGTTFCDINGLCGIDCGSNANDQCETSDDCPEDWYCSESRDNPLGIRACNANGFCNDAADCDHPDNELDLIDCQGTKTCNNGECGIDCNDQCDNSKDCGDGWYCSLGRNNPLGLQVCNANGYCNDLSDCKNPDNEFDIPDCDGTMTCTNGECITECVKLEGCSSSKECPDGMYCSTSPDTPNTCLLMGSCFAFDDCKNKDNSYMSIGCVGEIFCENGHCGKSCDEGEIEEPPVIPPTATCPPNHVDFLEGGIFDNVAYQQATYDCYGDWALWMIDCSLIPPYAQFYLHCKPGTGYTADSNMQFDDNIPKNPEDSFPKPTEAPVVEPASSAPVAPFASALLVVAMVALII